MVDLRSRFGDIYGQKVGGNVSINSRRSDISLSEITGQFNIESHYGIVEIFANTGLTDLNITGEHTDVFLYNTDPKLFGYSLLANNGKVDLPNDLDFRYVENSNTQKKIHFKPVQENFANITISISFGNVQVEKRSKP